MHWNDLNDGSIKALLILVLILANIAIALAHHRASSQPLGSVREAHALTGQPPR